MYAASAEAEDRGTRVHAGAASWVLFRHMRQRYQLQGSAGVVATAHLATVARHRV